MGNFYFFDEKSLGLLDSPKKLIYNLDASKKEDILTALNISIEKWEILYKAKKNNPNESFHSGWGNTCALCLINDWGECESEFYICPIYEFTDKDQCFNTPHASAVSELYHQSDTIHTKRMLDFLIEVREWYKREKLND